MGQFPAWMEECGWRESLNGIQPLPKDRILHPVAAGREQRAGWCGDGWSCPVLEVWASTCSHVRVSPASLLHPWATEF